MGQKANPILIRLGKTIEWKSKYYEKKSTEHAIHLFKDLEVRSFISQYFKNLGLAVHQTKLYYLENSLHIFVSYYITLKSALVINQINKAQKLKLVAHSCQRKRKPIQDKRIKSHIKNLLEYQSLDYAKDAESFFPNKEFSKKTYSVIKNQEVTNKIRRLKTLKYHKKFSTAKTLKTFSSIKNNAFMEKLLEGLKLFINRNISVFLTLKQLNKDIKLTFTKEKLKSIKRVITQLRKYKQYEFFKEGINLVLISVTNSSSSALLADFIANQIKKLKRHNPFIKFIKTALTLFISNSLSPNVKGIKLKAKGRFNGAPRAKHKIIKIGSGVPVLSIASKIDYSEATAYTTNGTFGIKVWIYENF